MTPYGYKWQNFAIGTPTPSSNGSIICCCKNGISYIYTNCRWKKQKQDNKWAKTLQRRCFGASVCKIPPLEHLKWFGTDQISWNSACWSDGIKKHLFLEGFWPFSVFFLHRQFVYETDILKTKLDISDRRDELIQSSTAPQGSPPPPPPPNNYIRNSNQLSGAINS